MSTMWSELTPAWRLCLEEAWAAYAVGTNPVGAVITNADGSVIARGRNRIHDTASAPAGHLSRSRLAHAEMNALLDLSATAADPRTCSLYTTCEPCAMCTGAIAMHRLREVHYASRDTWAGSLELFERSEFMTGRGVALRGPEWPELEDQLVALHVEYTLWKGFAMGPAVIEVWSKTHPSATEAGRRLREDGELRALAARGGTAEEGLALLAARTLDPKSV